LSKADNPLRYFLMPLQLCHKLFTEDFFETEPFGNSESQGYHRHHRQQRVEG
jgi:hypothetical protein